MSDDEPDQREAAGERLGFSNTYHDPDRAASYASLEYPGTYWLAFRDLPEIIGRHVRGRRALDFGCGAGRSTRFLKGLGLDAVGVDISRRMLEAARDRDPEGSYEWLGADGERPITVMGPGEADLVLCAYPFDNIPAERRVEIMRGLARLLGPEGRIVLLASSPELYVNEWASFTTAAFPENRRARSGDPVRIVMTDVADARPVDDFLWTDDDYRALFDAAGLSIIETARPLGRDGEPVDWGTERRVAPWAIHVAGASASAAGARPPAAGATTP